MAKRPVTRRVQALEEQLIEILEALRSRDEKILRLEIENERLRKRLHGRKSERTDQISGLIPWDVEGEDAESDDSTSESKDDDEPPLESEQCSPRGGSKKGRARGVPRLPDDLPRVRREHLPPEEDQVCSCCGEAKVRCGEEVRTRLECVPASLVLVDDVKIKMACRRCSGGFVTGIAPPTPIERGLPGSSLLSFILTSKYAEHSTLYRLEDILERHHVEFNRSTLCGWVAAACELLSPIVDEIRRQVCAASYIQTDDTGVCFLGGPGVGGSKRGYLWIYRADPGNSFYEFTEERNRDGPERTLRHYRGYVQADAFPGYNRLFKSVSIVEVGCWAHARRKFVEAIGTAPKEASMAVGMIRLLYRIEANARMAGLDSHARRALRVAESVPILRMIKDWLKSVRKTVLPKSPLGAAVGYLVNQWRALRRYTYDGRLEIDNNAAERGMRCIALGRKNWLFMGSRAAADRIPVILSLVNSCNELHIDPFLYLRDALDLVSTTPASRVHELTPKGWLAQQVDPSKHRALSALSGDLEQRTRVAFAAGLAIDPALMSDESALAEPALA